MDKFIRSQKVERYSRLLERVTEESDRQLIINLLAEEQQKKKTLAIRSGKSHGMAANFAKLPDLLHRRKPAGAAPIRRCALYGHEPREVRPWLRSRVIQKRDA
jgi:hypothetical protein